MPKSGRDSIWIAASGRTSVNPRTRTDAIPYLDALISEALAQEERLLIGFDFAFGYPAGFAAALGLKGWREVWAHLSQSIKDGPDNRSNRFDVAAQWNRALAGDGPFWGYTMKQGRPDGLSTTKPKDWPHAFAYHRHAEQMDQRAKSVFQLAYTGAVGSQSLLGIAHLEALRRRYAEKVAIWPFESHFAEDLNAPIIFAEIYPARHRVADGPEVMDQRQVEAVLRDFELWNGPTLRAALSAPDLDQDAIDDILTDEGWIVGLTR